MAQNTDKKYAAKLFRPPFLKPAFTALNKTQNSLYLLPFFNKFPCYFEGGSYIKTKHTKIPVKSFFKHYCKPNLIIP